MDEKILALLSAAGGTLASGLVLFGVFREKFRSLLSDVADLKREHVARSDYEQELLAIHKRIDRHSKESDERSKDTQKLLSDIGRDLSELKGFMRGRFGNKETHEVNNG